MRSQQKYIFGRINILGSYEDKDKTLYDGLTKSEIYTQKINNYGFYEVVRLEFEDELYFTGFLAKYRPKTEIETAQPIERTLGDSNIDNLVIAKSRFFLHLESGIIAYHPAAADIPDFLFREVFVRIIQDFYKDFFIRLDFTAITDEHGLFGAIESFESVDKITVRLHPSNPSNREIWQNLDKRLKDLKAKSVTESYDLNAPPNVVSNDPELKAKLTMAEDGYGSARIRGTKAGKPKIVSTKNFPSSGMAPSDEHSPKTVLGTLSEFFKEIKKRFSK